MKKQVPLQSINTETLQGEVARRNLKEYVKLFWPLIVPNYRFLDNWHLDAICDHLNNLDQIRNLLINMPARCGKSLLIDVFYPSWKWLQKPGTKYIYCSYGLGLAEDSSAKCRDVIESPLYQKLYGNLFKLKADQNLKYNFANTKGGSRLATSPEGLSTGFGADCLVMDDPHNAKKAESDAERQRAIDFYFNSFFNRCEDPNSVTRIIVGQRVHKKDLSGFILDNYEEDWVHLNLPYEYRATEQFIGWEPLKIKDPRTQDGEPLWPARFPESEIRQYKKQRGVFETQYNQRPCDAELSLFKPDQFRYYTDQGDLYLCGEHKVSKANCFRLISTDIAFSQTSRADWTVFMVFDIARTGEIVLLKMHREKMLTTKLVPSLVQLHRDYRAAYVLVEDTMGQRIIIDQLKQEGIPVKGINPAPLGDKETRAFPLQIRMESGQVWFPKDAPWLAPLERELLDFPNGKHDDAVDTIAMAAMEANRWGKRAQQLEAKPETKEEKKLKEEKRYQEGLHWGLIASR